MAQLMVKCPTCGKLCTGKRATEFTEDKHSVAVWRFRCKTNFHFCNEFETDVTGKHLPEYDIPF